MHFCFRDINVCKCSACDVTAAPPSVVKVQKFRLEFQLANANNESSSILIYMMYNRNCITFRLPLLPIIIWLEIEKQERTTGLKLERVGSSSSSSVTDFEKAFCCNINSTFTIEVHDCWISFTHLSTFLSTSMQKRTGFRSSYTLQPSSVAF